MSEVKIAFTKVSNFAKAPEYKTAGAAGCDVYACDDVYLPARELTWVKTGLCLEIPEGYECQVRPRSSTASTFGSIIPNSPGTVDSDYRGELKILMWNLSNEAQEICRGDRIAQLVFAPVCRVGFEQVDKLSKTDRGDGAFGSTGRGKEDG